ncbi:MAG: DUF1048 domain-containing protein [Propionibacteriaceae bacterium]|jgi:DNA-binding ferritin-like protein (Dps family)|nr:DUF1048 domain-containing protein [Propionibacteriaceae bacterium]
MIEWLKRQLREKRRWREHKRLVAALPYDYQTAYRAIEQYIWNSGYLDGGLPALYSIRELFEEHAADGHAVLDVIGDDVAAFVNEVLAASGSSTWLGKKGDQLNSQLHDQLGDPNAR